jgi:hypothetical protein
MAISTGRAARSGAIFLVMGMLTSGCSFVSDSLWPSLTGGDPKGRQRVPIAQSEAERNPQPTLGPALGQTNFVPPAVSQGATTGTFVGQKVAQYRGELQSLQGRIGQQNGQLQQIRGSATENSQRYHGTVAAVTTRLQMGTTPGNPVLVNQWNAAQVELDRMSSDIGAMNSLANEVASASSLAAYLLEASRATYGLSGAIDEDHRQLAVLEDETNRTVVLIDRLLNELSDDISRQTAYVGNERANLTTLALAIKNGELYGQSLGNRAYASSLPTSSLPPPGSTASRSFAAENRRPLVVIRFDRPNPPYEQALYTAVSRALERRPSAAFDVVAVAPNRGSTAQVSQAQTRSKRNADQVLRTLNDMGLPQNRVSVSSTTSPDTAVNEVHIYVR